MNALYPINLDLHDRPVLLVGGGPVALQKSRSLVDAGAHVHVVAPEVLPELSALVGEVSFRAFDASRDLDAMTFVVTAAPPEVNSAVSAAAHARGLFVLAVDHQAVGSAQSPAVLRRAGLTIAISTDGVAPALAGLLREALEVLLPDDAEAGRWIALAQRAKAVWKRDAVPHAGRRPLLVEALSALYAAKNTGQS